MQADSVVESADWAAGRARLGRMMCTKQQQRPSAAARSTGPPLMCQQAGALCRHATGRTWKSAALAPNSRGSVRKSGRGPRSPNWPRQKERTQEALKPPASQNMSVAPFGGKNDSLGTNCGAAASCRGVPAEEGALVDDTESGASSFLGDAAREGGHACLR